MNELTQQQMNIAPHAMAEHILAMLQVCYGEEFQKKFANNSTPEMLIAGLSFVLDGLTAQEIQNGLKRMKTEKWCPSLPEFRSWCLVGSEWWDCELAWAKALQFLNNKQSVKITTLTKQCLDEVKYIIENESQNSAHKAFRSIYENYLTRAKKAGRVQEFYVPPVLISDEPTMRNDVVVMPVVLVGVKQNIKQQADDKVIAQFQTINDFYAEHGRYPSNDKIAEMSMYRQLDMFKSDKKLSALLKPYDVHGLIFGKKVA